MNSLTAILTVPAALAIGFVAGRSVTVDAAVEAAAPTGTFAVQPVAALQDDATNPLTDPGDHHRMLDVMAGEWNARISSYMPGMDEPLVMEGTLDSEWILGDRFLKHTYDVPLPDGSQFIGMSFMGYSPAERVYESFWMDNMTVDMGSSSGFVSPDGMSFTMLTAELDAESMSYFDVEERITISDRNSYTYERYRITDTGEALQMSIAYTRKPAAGN